MISLNVSFDLARTGVFTRIRISIRFSLCVIQFKIYEVKVVVLLKKLKKTVVLVKKLLNKAIVLIKTNLPVELRQNKLQLPVEVTTDKITNNAISRACIGKQNNFAKTKATLKFDDIIWNTRLG